MQGTWPTQSVFSVNAMCWTYGKQCGKLTLSSPFSSSMQETISSCSQINTNDRDKFIAIAIVINFYATINEQKI